MISIMSFWPFSNSLNNNSQLQKFLDSIQDVSLVTSDELLEDPVLLQELISELHNIKSNYSNNNHPNFPFLQQNDSNNTTVNSTNSDAVSFTSSNNETTQKDSKDTRSAKLLELLLQPHILNGFLDHIVNSVEFFHELSIKEAKELEDLIKKSPATVELTTNDEVEIDEDEDKDDHEGEEDRNEAVEEDEDKDKAEEDSETKEEKLRRLIQSSSDILSIDLWVILNRIIETPIIMGKLWLILQLENLQESSPSVSYFVHILDQLMDTNSIELLNFIRRQPDLVDTFLNKIEIPMLMDLFLRVIQTDKQDSPTGILETLHQQDLIPKLIDILKPHASQFVEDTSNIPNHELFFKQTAATDFIKALVTISSNTALAVVLETNIGPNQLTRELVSPKIINIMIHDIMLYRHPSPDSSKPEFTNKHGINNCVGIIIELIRKNNSDYDLNCGTYSSLLHNENGGSGEVNSYVMYQWLKDFEQNPPGPRDPIYLGEMLYLFSENLDKFSQLMNLKPVAPAKVDQDTILGFTKFKISELIAELLHCSNMILLNSKKIRKIIHLRDDIRIRQTQRLKKALEDCLINSNDTTDDDSSIHDVTNGIDDISFNDNKGSKDEENKIEEAVSALELEDASDDDEPSISPENPFVCEERNLAIRSDPCVGDYFKTQLLDLKILFNIISKFTEFPWHNFFHNVVFDLIQQIFNGKLNSYNSFLIVDLFDKDKCNLTSLIVNSYQENVAPRPGYMGHLILISEEVVKFTSLYKPDLISPVIVHAISSEKWEWFVNEILLKTREVYNVVLGADQDEEDIDEDGNKRDHGSFGFDSSTVGYLDLESYDNNDNKNLIILGDSHNHEAFINDQGDKSDDDNDDSMEEPDVPDVRIQNMSPGPQKIDGNDPGDDDYDQQNYPDNDFLDNLSGSSSSDDDDDDDDNELRRVPKHND